VRPLGRLVERLDKICYRHEDRDHLASGRAVDATLYSRTVTGSGMPAGATIASVTNATTIVLSVNATLTAAGVTLTFGNLGLTTQSTGFSFEVTTASTAAGTFTVSGLSVVGVLSPGNGTLTVTASSSPCTSPTATATYTTNTTAFSAFSANRIYGQVADGTAC